ncbi:MAG: hypothetical protein LBJ03_02470 [Holosporales bacterium]|jgi:hypothetical protein|nr:hypothetical protein [Holosporales bacterium]
MSTYENQNDDPVIIARFKKLIELTKTSTHQISAQFRIPESVVNAWLDGSICINQKTSERLVDIFAKLGAYFESDWLLHGNGSEPALEQKPKKKNNRFKRRKANIDPLNRIAPILEAKYFAEINPGGIVYVVSSCKMEPIYDLGGYVGTVPVPLEDIESFIGSNIVMETSDGVEVCRLGKRKDMYMQEFFLESLSVRDRLVRLEEIKKIRLIVWYRGGRVFTDSSHKIRLKETSARLN